LTPNKFRIASAAVRPVRWPLRRPFVTALGSKSFSENVLLRLTLSGGAPGYGEASSSLAMARQTAPKMAAALRRLCAGFRGRDVRDAGVLSGEIWRAEGAWPTAAAAFETAVWDAFARACGVPFFELWGGASRELATLMTVSAVAPDEAFAAARAASRAGFRARKLKLNGRDPEGTDRARVRQARRAAPRARLLLDPNQSYRPDRLAALLDDLRRDGVAVELVEQPFPKNAAASFAAFRRKSRVPVVLDESVQTPADARRAVRGRLAAGVNVKLAKSGLLRGRAILREFSRARAPLFMVGCMAESRLGLAAAVHFACGLGVFDYADLDSDVLLKPAPVRGGYERRGPVVRLPRRPPPGLGVSAPGLL
jgi:L-Ala-D/L-Glu epimerase